MLASLLLVSIALPRNLFLINVVRQLEGGDQVLIRRLKPGKGERFSAGRAKALSLDGASVPMSFFPVKVSPDGRRIAVMAKRGANAYLFVGRSDGAEFWKIGVEEGQSCVWSPDSRKLAVFAQDETGGRVTIVDSQSIRKDHLGKCASFTWSHNGQKAYWSQAQWIQVTDARGIENARRRLNRRDWSVWSGFGGGAQRIARAEVWKDTWLKTLPLSKEYMAQWLTRYIHNGPFTADGVLLHAVGQTMRKSTDYVMWKGQGRTIDPSRDTDGCFSTVTWMNERTLAYVSSCKLFKDSGDWKDTFPIAFYDLQTKRIREFRVDNRLFEVGATLACPH